MYTTRLAPIIFSRNGHFKKHCLGKYNVH